MLFVNRFLKKNTIQHIAQIGGLRQAVVCAFCHSQIVYTSGLDLFTIWRSGADLDIKCLQLGGRFVHKVGFGKRNVNDF